MLFQPTLHTLKHIQTYTRTIEKYIKCNDKTEKMNKKVHLSAVSHKPLASVYPLVQS